MRGRREKMKIFCDREGEEEDYFGVWMNRWILIDAHFDKRKEYLPLLRIGH